MDRGYNDSYQYEQRVEEWREKRVQRMANRLQRNSDQPRTVSSSILGYGNYRQPLNLKPGQRQPEDPRYNNHGVVPRWNPNYNYSGYGEHNAQHNQYQRQQDYRVDHRSHGSYHSGQGQKRGHHSSQKSFYYNRKAINNPNKKYSSCNSISSTNEEVSSNVSHAEQRNEIKNENLVFQPKRLGGNEDIFGTLEPESKLGNASSIISPEVVIDVSNLCESFIPDPFSVVDDYDAAKDDKTVVDHSDYVQNTKLCDNNSPEKLPVIDCGSAVTIEEEIVEVASIIDPRIVENSEIERSEATVTAKSCDQETPVEHDEYLYTEEETVAIVEKSVESENVAIVTESESVDFIEVSLVPDAENGIIVDEQTIVVQETVNVERLVSETQTNEIPPISPETTYENSTMASSAEKMMIIEPDISSLTPCETVNVEMLVPETQTNEIPPISPETTYENSTMASSAEKMMIIEPDISSLTPCETVNVEMLVPETQTNEIPPISPETTYENSTMASSAEKMMIIEPDISSLTPCETVNESLGLELSWSYENDDGVDNSSELRIVKETEPSETNVQSDEVIKENEIAGTSGNHDNSDVPAAETEASLLVSEEHDIDKEIVNVRNKLANISIANTTNDKCADSGFMTPCKKERNKVLLDATNIILPSSTIKYAVREVRKKDEINVIVTPVRRSLRISSVRTPVSKKNFCVQNLEELSPEIKQKMKFVPNPSIDSSDS